MIIARQAFDSFNSLLILFLRRFGDSNRERRMLSVYQENWRKRQVPAWFTDKWVELDDLRKAMSPDTVFVDVVRLRVVDFEVKGNGNKWKDAHYAAWITPAAGQGDVKLID